jgi:hypothetical protein
MRNFKDLREKTLTPAEKKKREEIAKAMERENPGMDMKKKMAIATWQAKKVAEETELDEGLYHVSYGVGLDHQVVAKDASDAHQKAMAHFKKTKPKLNDPKYSDTFNKKTITRIKGDEPRSDKYKTEEVEIDEGKNLTDTKADWRSDKSATAKNWSHNKLMKVAKHDRSAEKEIKRRIASKEYVFANEEVELDELNKSTLGSYIKRAAGERGHAGIEAGASASGSKDQKDAMSTMKKRLKGIKMASDRLAKESVEELDELKKSTLGSYIKKANVDAMKHAQKSGEYSNPDQPKHFSKAMDRMRGVKKATDKLVAKEEVEQVDEISRDLARRYIRKVADKTNTGELSTKEVEKRRPGVHLAGKKAYPGIAGKAKVSATEAVEPIDEISKKTLGSYVKKSADDLTHIQRDITSGSVKDPEYKSLSRMRKNRKAGIARAVTSLTKEQAEDDMPASPDEKSMAMSQAKFIEYVAEEIKEYIENDKPFPEWMQNKLSSLHENAKDMHAVLAGDYGDDDEMEESVTTSPLQKIRMDKEKADRNKDDKDKSQAKRMTDKQYAGYKVKMKEEAVQSADRKPEKYVRPDGKVAFRMVRQDKKVIEFKEFMESESSEAGYRRHLVKTTDPEHKAKGMNWRIKDKERPEISIKLYKEKPSQSEFNKQMRQVAVDKLKKQVYGS